MQDTVKLDREKYIGGSDIPIIMGISPFKSRFDLLLEKAEIKENNFTGNVYTEYGNTMEPKIRAYINSLPDYRSNSYGEGLHFVDFRGLNKGELRLHTDGENEDSILEIKTTSQIHENIEDYKLYLVQLLFYMNYTGKNRGLLAVYERPDDLDEELDINRLHLYSIRIYDYEDLLLDIIKAVDEFLSDLNKVKANPFITEAELMPQDITTIANRVIELEDRLKAYKAVEKRIKEEKEALKNAMKAHNVKSWETPNGIKVTLVEDTPAKTTVKKVFNEDKLKEEQPELYNSFVEEKEVTSSPKKGYVKITIPKE